MVAPVDPVEGRELDVLDGVRQGPWRGSRRMGSDLK